MALDSIWQPQINGWLSGQPMPVDDFGKPLPPTLAGLVPLPAPTQQAVLGGRPYDPTKLSPPPQQGPAPSPLAAALTSTQAGNAPPRPVVTGGPNNDALAQALLGNANSKAPIFSPIDLLGRLAQVYSGNKLEHEAVAAAEQKTADAAAAKNAADAARRQQLIDIYNKGGGSPDALIQAGLAGGSDALVTAGLTAKEKANAPVAPYTDLGKINADQNAGRISPAQAATETAKLTNGGRPFTDAERKQFGVADGQAGYMDAQGVPHVLGGSNISIDLGSGGGSTPLIGGVPDPQVQAEFLAHLSPDTAATVKGIANYDLDLTKVTSLRGNQREQMTALVKQYDPTFDMTQYPARAAMKKSITSGTYSQTINSANLVIQHLDALHNAIADLSNTDFPLVNAGKNTFRQQTGDPAITRFNTAADAAASELAKVFKGSGVSDVQSVQEWRHNLDINGSPQQIQQAIDTAIGDLLASRLDTVRTQYEGVMGKPYDFTFLTPHSRDVLKNLGIDVSRLDPNSVTASPNLTGQPAPAGGPARVANDDDYTKLKSGDHFIDPNGAERVKP